MTIDNEDRELLAKAGVVASAVAVALLSAAAVLGFGWRLFALAAGL